MFSSLIVQLLSIQLKLGWPGSKFLTFLSLPKMEFQSNNSQFHDIWYLTINPVYIGQCCDSIIAEIIAKPRSQTFWDSLSEKGDVALYNMWHIFSRRLLTVVSQKLYHIYFLIVWCLIIFDSLWIIFWNLFSRFSFLHLGIVVEICSSFLWKSYVYCCISVGGLSFWP